MSKRPAYPYKPQTVTTFGSETGHRCSELPCVVHLFGRRQSTCTSKRQACKCAVVCLTIISRLPAPLNALAENPRVNGALGEHSPVLAWPTRTRTAVLAAVRPFVPSRVAIAFAYHAGKAMAMLTYPSTTHTMPSTQHQPVEPPRELGCIPRYQVTRSLATARCRSLNC